MALFLPRHSDEIFNPPVTQMWIDEFITMNNCPEWRDWSSQSDKSLDQCKERYEVDQLRHFYCFNRMLHGAYLIVNPNLISTLQHDEILLYKAIKCIENDSFAPDSVRYPVQYPSGFTVSELLMYTAAAPLYQQDGADLEYCFTDSESMKLMVCGLDRLIADEMIFVDPHSLQSLHSYFADVSDDVDNYCHYARQLLTTILRVYPQHRELFAEVDRLIGL